MPGPRAKKEEPARRRPGRPKKGTGPTAESVKVTAIVPAGLAIALENEAADRQISLSAVIADWLAFALAEKWSK